MWNRIRKKRVVIPVVVLLLLFLTCGWYVSDYYHATDEAAAFLEDSADVLVKKESSGLFFDGPGSEKALVFYPGGKVEYTAYAPLMMRIAERGMDCFLLRMPLNIAFLGINKADDILKHYAYPQWYAGGHSLGGVAASLYSADHEVDGLILLASYPLKKQNTRILELYGSEDGVLNMKKRAEADRFLTEGAVVEVIEGGNHAGFGNYGEQSGDGEAKIRSEEQQSITAEKILLWTDRD